MSTAPSTYPVEQSLTAQDSAAIRRGLWVVALIVAAGISIAGFSLASGLFYA